MNPKDFPKVVEILKRNCIFNVSRRHKWFQIEEKFYDAPDMLFIFIEHLIHKNHISIALSMIYRHNIIQNGLLNEDVIEKISPFLMKGVPNLAKFSYKENPLFENDDYCPSEIAISTHQKDAYLTFEDFGLNPEKVIHFIKDTQSDIYHKAKEDLLNSTFVGIDSESICSTTKFTYQIVSTLQLASTTKVYIFDILALNKNEEFVRFLFELFMSPKVIKVLYFTLKI